jgi:N-acetylmuramoyl-L-alanine amidase
MKLNALVLPVTAAVLLTLGAPALAQCPTEGCPAQSVGTIEVPAEGALVSGYVRVSGFGLNGNLVSNVDLYVDGTDEANRVTPAGGANINLPRPDVTQALPQYAGTPGEAPGFEMSFRAANYSNGAHTLYIRVTDVTGCCYFLAPRAIRIDNARNQPPFGALNVPIEGSSVHANGVLAVAGWALDDRRVEHVDVFIDGLLEREAVVGVNRPDVAAYYPNVPGATDSGFVIFIDATRLTNGVHELTVKATDDQGQQGLIASRRFQSFPNAPNLPPFGDVNTPLAQATWFGNCLRLPGGPSGGEIRDTRYIMFVSGWALDTSIFQERGGVSHVFLELDGVVLKDTRGAFGTLGCRREANLNNALVDCYGFYRPDVNIFYPGFPQSANSGYFFAVDVGYLLTDKGVKEGNHMLQIKAADKEDNVTLLKEVPVHLECATQNLDPSPLGYVDDPSNYEFVGGIFPVLGWALDLDTVIRVRVLIDGVPQVDAVTGHDYAEYGLPSPDVSAIYPNYPQRGNARWRFYLDTTKIANSEHDLLVEVIDGRGHYRSAGTRRFIVNNNTLTR